MNGYDLAVGNVLSPGSWVNIVGTVDGSGLMNLYENGALIGTKNAGTNVANLSFSNNYIGKSNWAGDSTWDGKISNVQIYNRALTASEATQNFNAVRSRYGM